jgi:hypothetical protein
MEVEPTDKSDTRFLWWLSIGAVFLFVFPLGLLSYFLRWHWLSNLWFNYAWSSDKGNGPEAIQQTVIYGLVAIAVVPWVHRYIKAEFHKMHMKIEEGQKAIHAKLDKTNALSHFIIQEHPDIDETKLPDHLKP